MARLVDSGKDQIKGEDEEKRKHNEKQNSVDVGKEQDEKELER